MDTYRQIMDLVEEARSEHEGDKKDYNALLKEHEELKEKIRNIRHGLETLIFEGDMDKASRTVINNLYTMSGGV